MCVNSDKIQSYKKTAAHMQQFFMVNTYFFFVLWYVWWIWPPLPVGVMFLAGLS